MKVSQVNQQAQAETKVLASSTFSSRTLDIFPDLYGRAFAGTGAGWPGGWLSANRERV